MEPLKLYLEIRKKFSYTHYSKCKALLLVAASLQQWQRKININLENIAISSLYKYTFVPHSFH